MISAHYEQQIKSAVALAAGTSLWHKEAAKLIDQKNEGFADTDGFLQHLHELQRLHKIFISGLENNQPFKDDVIKDAQDTWQDFQEPPASSDLQINLAKRLYNAETSDSAIIQIGDRAKLIGLWLVNKAISDNIDYIVQFDDPYFNAHLINYSDEAHIDALAQDFLDMTAPVNKRILAVSGSPDREVEQDRDKKNQYINGIKSYSERVSSGDIFFTLTVIPTPKDAIIDGFDYNDFIKLFFEMCDQPWDHIDKAHRELIKEFNAAKHVRITNSDGTDIQMDIDGYTFCNSLIAKNVPGSEIFSAPRRDSVEGKIVAKGRFERNGKIIENLTLEFNKGKLVKYSADSGLEAFEDAISVDEGALFTGELGIGTNPHLKTHVANSLLVEKIGGSFHMALGKAYTMTDYEGDPVNVDNGNKSGLHWDITTMLHGKEGKIYLDGRLVMDHGQWLDTAKYDVLNRGWAAVPKEDRPDYWKNLPKAPQPKSPAP